MAMTEAEKQACLRYQKKLVQFNIKLKPEDMAKYKQAAEQAGMSFRAWILQAMDKAMTTI
jgi:predicted HicB family RNase H-like nuclease